jgi:hypothetical protein
VWVKPESRTATNTDKVSPSLAYLAEMNNSATAKGRDYEPSLFLWNHSVASPQNTANPGYRDEGFEEIGDPGGRDMRPCGRRFPRYGA